MGQAATVALSKAKLLQVPATIKRMFGTKGKAHGQESTVRGYQLVNSPPIRRSQGYQTQGL
jgi:hypothetical protein